MIRKLELKELFFAFLFRVSREQNHSSYEDYSSVFMARVWKKLVHGSNDDYVSQFEPYLGLRHIKS